MIYINVTGTRNKKKAALARDAAIFAFEHLMPRMKKQVDLEIVFVRTKLRLVTVNLKLRLIINCRAMNC